MHPRPQGFIRPRPLVDHGGCDVCLSMWARDVYSQYGLVSLCRRNTWALREFARCDCTTCMSRGQIPDAEWSVGLLCEGGGDSYCQSGKSDHGYGNQLYDRDFGLTRAWFDQRVGDAHVSDFHDNCLHASLGSPSWDGRRAGGDASGILGQGGRRPLGPYVTIPRRRSLMMASASVTMRSINSATVGMSWMRPCARLAQ